MIYFFQNLNQKPSLHSAELISSSVVATVFLQCVNANKVLTLVESVGLDR